MNPKMKRKLIIDVILAAVMIILMQPLISGVFAHEWLGVIIGGALVAHLAINRQWIAAVGKGFFSKISWQARINFMINSMMAISMTLTLLSGVLISQFLFTPLAAANYSAWTAIHSFSSWATLLIVIIHVLLHADWIKRVIRTLIRDPHLQPVRTVVVRATLGLFALGAAYSVIQTSAIEVLLATQDQDLAIQNSTMLNNSTSSSQATTDSTLDDIDQGTAVIDSLPASSAQTTTESSIVDNSAAAVPTLTQYLSNFTCTACHKHCLLSAPRCGKGDPQVEQYTAQYYSEYPEAAN
ncbi:MAG: DUF4405 domain-containing protein [Eubacteriales bacterium]|nr:DUF4405 domain-containing protein [Eubacteriales bacterium]